MDLVKYIGLPYVDREHDCWILIKNVLKEQFKIVVPSYGDLYTSSDVLPETGQAFSTGCQDGHWDKVEDIQVGDVIIFRFGRFACHAGLCVGEDEFIHCLRGRNTSIEYISAWQERIEGVYRWRMT